MGVWNLNAPFLAKSASTVFVDNFETFSGWTNINGGGLTQSSAQKYEGNFSSVRSGNAAPAGATKLITGSVGRNFIIEYYGNHVSSGMRLALVNSSGNGYGMLIGSASAGIDRCDAYVITSVGVSSQTAYTRTSGKWYKGFLQARDDNTFLSRVIDPVTNSVLSESVSVADTTHLGSFDRVFITGGVGNYYDNVVIKRLN